MAGADLLVRGQHPSGLNLLKGSWLCDWSWPIAPGAHLFVQALKDYPPPRPRRARHLISEMKDAARTAGYARRKAAHMDGATTTRAATQHLLTYIAAQTPEVIAAYMPIRTEIDVLPAMHTLHTLGHRIAVPVIVGKGLPLSFKEWTPNCEMLSGPFGAAIPTKGDWLLPDLLITPLIAFNTDGYRLGYGGGFYDRSLQLLRAKRPTIAAGFGYAGQAGEVPVEETDQRLDAMVTENGVTRF